MSVRIKAPYNGGTKRWEYGGEEHYQVELLKTRACAAVEMYDRYCAHDQTMDLSDLGAKLELLREALAALGVEANGVSRFGL